MSSYNPEDRALLTEPIGRLFDFIEDLNELCKKHSVNLGADSKGIIFIHDAKGQPLSQFFYVPKLKTIDSMKLDIKYKL